MIAPTLSPDVLLRLWEQAYQQPSTHLRAVLLLSTAHPEEAWQELAEMSVGRREERLLALRERQMGQSIELHGECESCAQPIELTLNTRDLASMGTASDGGGEAPHRLESGNMTIDFRLPNSVDMDAAARCRDVAHARALLLDRCVLEVSATDGAHLAGSELPAEVQQALEEEMERLDPLAVVRLEMSCPRCSHRWEPRLDVSEVVWTELAQQAKRLLREVSTLARIYHWSEQSILAMSPKRRRTYLELAES